MNGQMKLQLPAGRVGDRVVTVSGTVDVEDLLMILGAYGGSDAASDVNGDGVTTVSDLLMLLGAWGECS
jgi:hypothetical protein